ncbi:MAG: DUF6884 domain-containing protein [Oscillochloridaceae bacterium umkhey_bin13]
MRLLILSCSARKRPDPADLPVLDRYDGPSWRLLRRYLREQYAAAQDLEVYALSAAYGLLAAATPIPAYEQTMTPTQADALRPAVLANVQQVLQSPHTHLCLSVSERYLRALEGWEALVPPELVVTRTDGPLGTKLGQLKAWLEGRTWAAPSNDRPTRLEAAPIPRGHAVLAGVTLHLSRDEVLAQARQALAVDGQGAERYRDWCVLVDGRPVGAKWLVSLISGLPTSRFDAANARRVLLALGIDVERTERRGAHE